MTTVTSRADPWGVSDMGNTAHHRVVIVGAGTAGIAVAARLANEGESDIAIIEPSAKHYYQPLWTLVGGGRAKVGSTERNQNKLIPRVFTGSSRLQRRSSPTRSVSCSRTAGASDYDALVVCPGIQLDWDQLPGSNDTLGRNGVSSNYRLDLAPRRGR